jgi:hypothetical protein
VSALELAVGRLEQRYRRLGTRRYDYAAPGLDFACVLEYGADGLVADYPGLALRAPLLSARDGPRPGSRESRRGPSRLEVGAKEGDAAGSV